MSHCLVMGATGYVGSLLTAALVADGHTVRALVRSGRPASRLPASVRVIEGDATDAGDVARAVGGADLVYYLVHSLARHDFADVDRAAAGILSHAAGDAGVSQIVYLGGTRPGGSDPPSEHLASRAEVGEILLDAVTPALVLRASMIIGAGSTSFELLRGFAEASPVIPRPGWMDRRSRPIAVGDVLHYLRRAVGLPTAVNGAFDLNGPETVTYLELVQRCARVAGLPLRLPVPTPVWSHDVAARLSGVLTSVPSLVAGPLLRSLEHDLCSTDNRIAEYIPAPAGGLTGVDRAMRLSRVRDIPPAAAADGDARSYVDSRSVACRATPDELWQVITGIGGSNGWYTIPLVWTLRGALDHAIGGVGLHRGRPRKIGPGDAVDSWTVEDRDDAARRLVLRADMKMPGATTMTMSATTDGAGMTRYVQTIRFRPAGTVGRLYWLAQRPVHDLVFSVMAGKLARRAEDG